MRAAVLHEVPGDLVIEDVDVDKPGPQELLVRTATAGVCHSDLHFTEGTQIYPLPCVLGHESAGVVEAVGANVRALVETPVGTEGKQRSVLRGRALHVPTLLSGVVEREEVLAAVIADAHDFIGLRVRPYEVRVLHIRLLARPMPGSQLGHREGRRWRQDQSVQQRRVGSSRC